MAKVNGLWPDLRRAYDVRVSVVRQLAAIYKKNARDEAGAAIAKRWSDAAEMVVAVEYDKARFAADLEFGGKDAEATAGVLAYRPTASALYVEREALEVKAAAGELSDADAARGVALEAELLTHETVEARQARELAAAHEVLSELEAAHGLRSALSVEELIEDGIIPAGV